MTSSNIKCSFECDIESVWKIVTDIECYPIWRNDLGKVEIINDKEFVEYTKQGYATAFTITTTVPYSRWEFDIENDNITGHWIGVFTQKGEHSEIDLTENVAAKKPFIKPFIRGYLRKQQAQFISDLKKALLP